jgi:serine/threonine-protein kinase
MIGSVIGNYKVAEKIGEGGMGAVYKGVDLMLEREVAIKALRPELSNQPQVVERFRKEAVTLAKLNHPNIATLFNFFRQGNHYFMVMEFVRGQTLDKLIEIQGAMSCETAVPLFCQVLEGIDHAHRFGIIHRDIKPANMMLTDEGSLKVLDFGIARVLGSSRMTRAGHLIGTVEYMSPEQIKGQETDARSDIYSLGMLLYEMLTGRVPFASDSEFELMKAQVEQMPTPPREFAPHIPEDVEWAIMCATAKDPEKRFQTAAAFRDAIVDSMSSAPASASEAVPDYSWNTSPLSTPPNTSPISKDSVVRAPAPLTRIASTTEMVVADDPPPVKTDWWKGLKSNRMFIPMMAGVLLAFLFAGAMGSWLLVRAFRGKQAEAAKRDAAEAQARDATSTPPPPVAPVPPAPPPGMVYVSGGEFMMGRDLSDGGDEFESPAHRVSVRPFFIDIYEVTREEYKKCVDEKKCAAPQGWTGENYPEGTGRQPVTGVTWDDATVYAGWANKRLPTEEEWEFAARGKEGFRYPWGNEWKADQANADGINKGLKDIGTYQGTSPFGAFDMVGNAWEWTASPMGAYPGRELSKPPASNEKVIRGGCYLNTSKAATTTFRMGWPAQGAKYESTGFRCAKAIEQ